MRKCSNSQVFSIVISGLLAVSLSGCNDSPMGATDVNGVNTDRQTSGEGQAPVACFTTDPDPPEIAAQQTITLDASCSENLASDASFTWDLGDGRAASGQRVETQYRRSGDYTVTLNIKSGGDSSTATEEIQRPAPRPGVLRPSPNPRKRSGALHRRVRCYLLDGNDRRVPLVLRGRTPAGPSASGHEPHHHGAAHHVQLGTGRGVLRVSALRSHRPAHGGGRRRSDGCP